MLPDVLLDDFGIARIATSTASSSQNLRGTPAYMASEHTLQAFISQTGVVRASIQLSGGNGQILPSDPTKITIVVQAISTT